MIARHPRLLLRRAKPDQHNLGVCRDDRGRRFVIDRATDLEAHWRTDRGDYVATKHGLVGLTKAVALEALPYNITCNALAPGSILTPHAERQVRERMVRDKLDWDAAAQEFLKTREILARTSIARQLRRPFRAGCPGGRYPL